MSPGGGVSVGRRPPGRTTTCHRVYICHLAWEHLDVLPEEPVEVSFVIHAEKRKMVSSDTPPQKHLLGVGCSWNVVGSTVTF